MSVEASTGQLLLLFSALEIEPDRCHPWARRSMFPGRQDEWRCVDCGELAVRGVITGGWEFLSPERGPDQWAKASHDCVKRAWN